MIQFQISNFGSFKDFRGFSLGKVIVLFIIWDTETDKYAFSEQAGRASPRTTAKIIIIEVINARNVTLTALVLH